MKALTWHGKRDVRVETVPEPRLQEPTDAIVRVTSSGICGSDLHLYEVMGPFIGQGDILGHEPMGVVEEVGAAVTEVHQSAAPALARLVRENRAGDPAMKLEQARENVFTLTLTSQELSALVAAGRMALEMMEHDPNAPADARELLGRVLREYDSARVRFRDENGR
jgi:alcohol dehydrogenase-like protein